MTANSATLSRAVFPRAGLLTDVLLVLAGTALVAASAQVSIPLPFTPVPITGQTFAVVLVGAALGPMLGFASLFLYLVIGIAGAPVYADGDHGWDTSLGPTGGYLIGFIAAAVVTGALAERKWDRRFPSSLAAMLTGNVLIYIPGLIWLGSGAGGTGPAPTTRAEDWRRRRTCPARPDRYVLAGRDVSRPYEPRPIHSSPPS